MNLLISLKNIILDTYLIIPFIFGFIIGIFGNLKSPIYLRRISIFFSFVQFFSASCMCILFSDMQFNFLNISFNFDKFSSILILLTSFIFFLLTIISKTFILKAHKAFWTVFFLIFGLINAVLLSDNIILSILNIVWIIFLTYFLNITFAYSNTVKKDITSQLKLDITIIAISIGLILFDFLRYFVLNDIEFCFSNIRENLYHINPLSVKVAFFGFLLLNLKLFNLIPFTCRNISNSPKINPIVIYLNIFSQIMTGCFLFFKTNIIFAYLYWDYQELIICYLLFNLFYYLILSAKFDSIYKFLNLLIIISFLINILSVFAFSEKGLGAYIYSCYVTIISFSALYFILSILSNKFKTDKFLEFGKIPPKNRKTIFFVIFSVLNFAGIPFLAMFLAKFQIFAATFGANLDNLITSIVPYACIFASLVVSIMMFKVFYYVLVAPVDFEKNFSKLSRHQNFVMTLISFFIIIIGFCANEIINGILLNI